jgi:ornithine carbamoyltransferase
MHGSGLWVAELGPSHGVDATQRREKMHNYLSVADVGAGELAGLLERAAEFKRKPAAARLEQPQAVALVFERPSLRTRAAYEVALMHLGGRAIAFDHPLGAREPMADVAHTLSHLVSAIVARVRCHESLQELVQEARIPVVNALSDREHPVEVLADALTLRQRWGDVVGRCLAYVGDGNNICHSLLLLAPLLGLELAVANPPGYAPRAEIVARAQMLAEEHGTCLRIGADPRQAVAGADAVYTDVWASMGQEDSAEERRWVFQPYQVNAQLLSLAKPRAVVLHCLPARRGEEVTAEVLEGPRSLAFQRLSNLIPVTLAVLHSVLAPA